MTNQNETRHEVGSELELNEKFLSTSSLGIAKFNADGHCVSANETMRSVMREMGEKVPSEGLREMRFWKKSAFLVDADKVLSTGIEKRRKFMQSGLLGERFGSIAA